MNMKETLAYAKWLDDACKLVCKNKPCPMFADYVAELSVVCEACIAYRGKY